MSDNPFATGAGGNDDFETTINTGRPPEGIAVVQLLNVTNEISKTSGNKMWVWEFSLREYVEPSDVGSEFLDELIKVYTALSKSAMWKLEETVNALGVSIGEGGAVKFKKEQVIGTIARAVIKHNDFNGKIQVNIDALAAPPEGAGTKRDMPTLNHSADLPSAETQAGPTDDDDIPF